MSSFVVACALLVVARVVVVAEFRGEFGWLILIRYDCTFMLMTAPHSGKATRLVDRRRGVYIDGMYYWNDKLAFAKTNEEAEVRVEIWCARVVYVCFRDEWIVAQARDGGTLEGRFRAEFEIQRREESRGKRTAAQQDKATAKTASKKVLLWKPEVWDPRLREQSMEAHYLYDRLGMTEVLPEAKNPRAALFEVGTPAASNLGLIRAVRNEPDGLPRKEYSAGAARPNGPSPESPSPESDGSFPDVMPDDTNSTSAKTPLVTADDFY